MKDVQCYEIFGGIALKNHASSFHFIFIPTQQTEGINTFTLKYRINSIHFHVTKHILPLILANSFCFHALSWFIDT